MTKIDLINSQSLLPNSDKLAGKIKNEKVPSFSETLQNMVEQVDQKHEEAGQAIKDFVAGKNVELHEVMAIREEAQISFQFMMEVRNKLIDAYQEISRMQV